MSEQQPLPFHFQFIAGAIAGGTEIMTMYPLDGNYNFISVVKTRFQLQVGTGGTEGYSSITDCFKKIIKNEGFGRLYRGILAPIMIEAPKRATKFAANGYYNNLLSSLGMSPGQKKSIVCGIMAGLTEATIIVPFELVKIRMQDQRNSQLYKSTFDAISKIFRQEGIFAFYNGLESTLWRHATWNGGYFGVIHFVRQSLPTASTKQETLRNNFIAGTIGGTFGTILNTPFDVVKTRIQNQLPGSVKYNWVIPSLGRIVREEGFSALYKGFLPKVLRLGPGGGILLVVFDQVTTLMQKYLL